jgi:hypothetical protein
MIEAAYALEGITPFHTLWGIFFIPEISMPIVARSYTTTEIYPLQPLRKSKKEVVMSHVKYFGY